MYSPEAGQVRKDAQLSDGSRFLTSHSFESKRQFPGLDALSNHMEGVSENTS